MDCNYVIDNGDVENATVGPDGKSSCGLRQHGRRGDFDRLFGSTESRTVDCNVAGPVAYRDEDEVGSTKGRVVDCNDTSGVRIGAPATSAMRMSQSYSAINGW